MRKNKELLTSQSFNNELGCNIKVSFQSFVWKIYQQLSRIISVVSFLNNSCHCNYSKIENQRKRNARQVHRSDGKNHHNINKFSIKRLYRIKIYVAMDIIVNMLRESGSEILR